MPSTTCVSSPQHRRHFFDSTKRGRSNGQTHLKIYQRIILHKMSLYFVIIKKGEIVNTNNVKNVIHIIRSSYVLIITKYKDMLCKVTVHKFLIKETRYFYVAASTSLQV